MRSGVMFLSIVAFFLLSSPCSGQGGIPRAQKSTEAKPPKKKEPAIQKREEPTKPPAVVHAKTAQTDPVVRSEQPVESPAETDDRISSSLGVDATSLYFFRGILQENQGFIAQPWMEASAVLFAGDGSLEEASLTVGTWNSLHSGPSGSGSGATTDPRVWYESDFYAGLSAELESGLSVSGNYTAYASPNGSFGTVQELSVGVSYDDSGHWGEWGGLQPSVTVAWETSKQADGGLDLGTYFELSLSPEWGFREDTDRPLTFSTPVTVGLSLDDYYEDSTGDDENFGFLDIGFLLGFPILFPESYGEWSMTLGGHLLWLGDHNEAVNKGDEFEIVGGLGFQIDF